MLNKNGLVSTAANTQEGTVTSTDVSIKCYAAQLPFARDEMSDYAVLGKEQLRVTANCTAC